MARNRREIMGLATKAAHSAHKWPLLTPVWRRLFKHGRRCRAVEVRLTAQGERELRLGAALHGTETWYSIISSARRNRADILSYLTDVLIRLPVIVTEYLPFGTSSAFQSLTVPQRSALAELLPDHWLAAPPQHLLSERTDELAAAQKRRRHRRALRRAATRQ